MDQHSLLTDSDKSSLVFAKDPVYGDIADSLLSQGQLALLKGDLPRGLELFDSSIKLDPCNPKLFFSQGLSLFDYGCEEGKEKALLLAGKKFKTATSFSPKYTEAWQAWGSTLCTLGLTYHEHHFFQEAADKLRRAISLLNNQSIADLSELYWDYGVVCSHLAEHSGEALDAHDAINSFQKACDYPRQLSSDFWIDFGKTCAKFAFQINDIHFYIKAISCSKHAISLDPSSSNGWSLLADSLHKLYQITHDEDHFLQANESFETATQLQPNCIDLWVDWAQFLIEAIRKNPDNKRILSCIEKCQQAHAIEEDQPLIQAIWAEALAMLGNQSERLDLIYDAQNKITSAIDEASDLPEVWFSYGMCLNTLARYFGDEDYYYQAIEKFQLGLSIDRTYHTHWHGIGEAYATLGTLDNDPELLERSLRFFQRAIDLNTNNFYIFDYAVALYKLGEMTHEQKWLEEAQIRFERILNNQRNAAYNHPDWLYHYGCTLDSLGDFHEENFYYLRAIEIFSHALMIDPDLHQVHHRLALALSHLGEFNSEIEPFFRAIHHYRLSLKHDEDNEHIILDWALTLINLAGHVYDPVEVDQFYRDAEHKLILAAKLGNLQSYYHLCGLHSLMGQLEKSMYFLEKADSYDALPPLDELLEDEWLDNLRETGDFREFIFQLEHRPNLQEEC